MSRPEAIILAAGQGSRMGCNKLLLPLAGQTVLERLLYSLPVAHFAKVILVYSDARVADLALTHGLVVVQNCQPELGKSHSIHLGLVAGEAARPVMFLVADQPLLTVATILRLLAAAQQHPRKIIQPLIDGQPANPVIFPADLRQELANLQGDDGGREVVRRHPGRLMQVPFLQATDFTDLDTPEDYQRLTTLWTSAN